MKIDLAMNYGDMPTPVGVSEEHYPSFHYEGGKDLGLPDEGVMKIHFCKTSSSVSERDGNKRYSCTVEVKKILDVEAEKDDSPTKRDRSNEDALDAIMEAVMKKKKKRGNDEEEDY